MRNQLGTLVVNGRLEIGEYRESEGDKRKRKDRKGFEGLG